VDLETTGLTPGYDRVVEVSVLRADPGQSARLALDTLVNPMRRVAATEVHGITDEDVENAPRFADIAGELVGALHECVIAAYNVYFDIRFLNYEFQQVGINHEPPHVCLMYLRPMLGLGSRCRLEEACRVHGIDCEVQHVAANDALASAKLLDRYLQVMQERGIRTYDDLASLKRYKFVNSFTNSPLPPPSSFKLRACDHLCSRSGYTSATVVDPTRSAVGGYWDALKTVVADLEITDDEVEYVLKERNRLGLNMEQIRAIHAKAFASVITQFTADKWLDDGEASKLNRLYRCLATLGWAPGQ
jgi:DNA polymerase-3 subunit epsilon